MDELKFSENPVANVLLSEGFENVLYHARGIKNGSCIMRDHHLIRLQAAIETWNLGKQLDKVK